MRSADNTILVEFREDWRWAQNAPALIQEYIANAEDRNWTSDGKPPSAKTVAHARAVLGHLAGVCTSPDSSTATFKEQ